MGDLGQQHPSDLIPDGERFIPNKMYGDISLEHWHRYAFSVQFVKDKRVLDLASGEGYGSAFLAKFAKFVIGVDISPEAVSYAKQKYSSNTLEFVVGTCGSIPLASNSIDVVVSFETIEHHDDHETMLMEIRRVLTSQGLLIISTPDKQEYSDRTNYKNPFHVRELYKTEFKHLIATYFTNVQLYGQRVINGSTLFAENCSQLLDFQRFDYEHLPTSSEHKPLYWVCIGSNTVLPSSIGGVLEYQPGALYPDNDNNFNIRICELILFLAGSTSKALYKHLHGSWYLENNPDLSISQVDPYEHWISKGFAEGRVPSSDYLSLIDEILSERKLSSFDAIDTLKHDLQKELVERQKEFKIEISQSILKAKEDLAICMKQLADQEQAADYRLSKLQESLRKDNAADRQLVMQQVVAMAESQKEQERLLRQIIESRTHELHRVQFESQDKLRALEVELARTKFKAKLEIENQLRLQSEREQTLTDRLEQLQISYASEIALQNEAAQQHLLILTDKHDQKERELHDLIKLKEREINKFIIESYERERHFEAEIANAKLEAQVEIGVQLDKFSQREHLFADKMLEIHHNLSNEIATIKNDYVNILSYLRSNFCASKSKWYQRLVTQSKNLLAARSNNVIQDKQLYSKTFNYKDRLNALSGISSSEIIPTVKTIDELFQYNDVDFITCAYLTFLGRFPDAQGLSYYLSRMKNGDSKIEIAYMLYRSKESKNFSKNINGMKLVIARNLLQKIPGIGWILKSNNKDLVHASKFASNDAKYELEQTLNSIIDVLDKFKHETSIAFKPLLVKHIDSIFAQFDGSKYLAAHLDVSESGMNPYEHWVRAGYSEGRWPIQHTSTIVDTKTTYSPIGVTGSSEPVCEPQIYSEAPINPKVRMIAFYLPQYHPIPENDEWWGKGFTEWTNVTRAKPFYAEHEQPKLPGELGFYDLRLIEVIKRQAELATVHGIYGFCFYLYWFAGKRLLDTPVNIILSNPNININFCYCWANENWTRTWDGLEDNILIGQSHSADDDIAFIENVANSFKDRRYIRIDGKPLLVLYRPNLLPSCKDTVERWRKWCRSNEIGEIYVTYVESFEQIDPHTYGMDSSIQFPPLSNGPHKEITPECHILEKGFMGKIYDYEYAVNTSLNYKRPNWTQYRSVMPGWDNTARKMERAYSFKGSTPDLYFKWLDNVAEETLTHFGSSGGYIFINAWNEWAEGAYLEPDKLRGYAYLNRTRDVVSKYSDHEALNNELLTVTKRKNDVAIIIHLYYFELYDVILKYLDNISEIADMYFSVRDGAYSLASRKIKKRYPHAVVLSYPNQGRDVLPFLKIVRHLRQMDYKAICKIHTKKSQHRIDGDLWRDDVLKKLLGTQEIVKECVNSILSGVGLIAPAGHLIESTNYWGSNAERVTRLAKKMGCPQAWIDKFFFSAGTMFWISPNALIPLLDLELSDDDFEAESGQVDGTTAHALERLVSLSVQKSGMSIIETGSGGNWDGSSYPFAAIG
jgi:lipopolysaccharide biosynthesis protein/ubiquinone/menaquinone biosynthesis C-methylase UbiE